jgi:hypothetical protein
MHAVRKRRQHGSQKDDQDDKEDRAHWPTRQSIEGEAVPGSNSIVAPLNEGARAGDQPAPAA